MGGNTKNTSLNKMDLTEGDEIFFGVAPGGCNKIRQWKKI